MSNRLKFELNYASISKGSANFKHPYMRGVPCCEDLDEDVAYDHVYGYATHRGNHRKDDFISGITFITIISNVDQKGNHYGY